MRRAKLARLKVSDIESQRMIIRVDGDLLVSQRHRRLGPEQPISDKSMWLACQEAARHAGLSKPITPHALRRHS